MSTHRWGRGFDVADLLPTDTLYNTLSAALFSPWWHRVAAERKQFCASTGVPDDFVERYVFLPPSCFCRPPYDAPLLVDEEGALDQWFVNVDLWLRVALAAATTLVRRPLAASEVEGLLNRWSGIDERVAVVRRLLAGHPVAWEHPSGRSMFRCTTFRPGDVPVVPLFADALHTDWIEPALDDLRRRGSARKHSH